MAFPQYSGWPQPPPWSAYGSAWSPASIATATSVATAGLCSPHGWPQAESRPLEHSPYAAAAALQHAPATSQLGALPQAAGAVPQMAEALAQVQAGHQPPVWPLWSSAAAAAWYPQAGVRGAPPTPAASSAALAAAAPAEGRLSGDASARDVSMLAAATSAAESEKENVPMGMNWGARMVDSLLAPDTFSEAFKDRPANAAGLLLTASPPAASSSTMVAGSSSTHLVGAGADLDDQMPTNLDEGFEQQDTLQDANFVEWRFHMLLARQHIMEKEQTRHSMLNIRTVPAHMLPSDIDGPPPSGANSKESSPQKANSSPVKAAKASPPSPVVAPLQMPLPPPMPQQLPGVQSSAKAGAFLLQLVKEPEKLNSTDATGKVGAAEGAALLRQLQSGLQPQPVLPAEGAKGRKDNPGKGSALMQHLMGPGTTNGTTAVKDGVAEGAALLKQLQAGPVRKDGAAEGAALLRQLQGAKEPSLAQSSSSSVWGKDVQRDGGGAKKDSGLQKDGGGKKRGKDRGHGKGGNAWW